MKKHGVVLGIGPVAVLASCIAIGVRTLTARPAPTEDPPTVLDYNDVNGKALPAPAPGKTVIINQAATVAADGSSTRIQEVSSTPPKGTPPQPPTDWRELPPMYMSNPNVQSGGTWRQWEVTQKNGGVNVIFIADFFDKRPGIKYFWSMTLSDENREIISRKDYLAQTFTMPEGAGLRPTFVERLELQPGKYNVRVDLFGVEPDFDFTKIHDQENANKKRVISKRDTFDVE